MEIQVLNADAPLDVSEAVFGVSYNEPLVHQVVTAFQAGARAGTKAQKSKAMVSGGGKKPWKQKGTGRARAGSIRSPLWRGGGKTFAAVPRDHSQKVNRKMYRGAIRSIFAELLRSGNLVVASDLAIEAPRTKSLLAKMGGYGVEDALIISEGVDKNLYLSARNLYHFEVRDVAAIDPVALLSYKKVLISPEAVKKVEAWLS